MLDGVARERRRHLVGSVAFDEIAHARAHAGHSRARGCEHTVWRQEALLDEPLDRRAFNQEVEVPVQATAVEPARRSGQADVVRVR